MDGSISREVMSRRMTPKPRTKLTLDAMTAVRTRLPTLVHKQAASWLTTGTTQPSTGRSKDVEDHQPSNLLRRIALGAMTAVRTGMPTLVHERALCTVSWQGGVSPHLEGVGNFERKSLIKKLCWLINWVVDKRFYIKRRLFFNDK